MMKGQARWSGLVMGFDTHMIAGAVPALRPAQPTQPNITNRSNPHYDETLTRTPSLPATDGRRPRTHGATRRFSTEKTASVHIRHLLARLGVAVAAKRSQSLTGSTSTSDDPAAALVSLPAPSLVSPALREQLRYVSRVRNLRRIRAFDGWPLAGWRGLQVAADWRGEADRLVGRMVL